MRKFVLALPLLLGACPAQFGTDDPKVILADACQGAASALRPAIAARVAGKLDPSFVTTIDQAGNVIDGFCRPGAKPMATKQPDGSIKIDWTATIVAVKNATASIFALNLGE